MRRRRLLLGVGLLAIVGAAALATVFLLPHPGSGITQANYERIREGMTAEEVRQVFDCPPGDYACPAEQHGHHFGAEPIYVPDADFSYLDWTGETCFIIIRFDAQGRVNGKRILPRNPAGAWVRLRRLLPW
jgi:hypothetical protein